MLDGFDLVGVGGCACAYERTTTRDGAWERLPPVVFSNRKFFLNEEEPDSVNDSIARGPFPRQKKGYTTHRDAYRILRASHSVQYTRMQRRKGKSARGANEKTHTRSVASPHCFGGVLFTHLMGLPYLLLISSAPARPRKLSAFFPKLRMLSQAVSSSSST